VIALELIGVRLEMPGRVHVVFLREREGERRVLPIYIGEPEAASIQIGMSGKVPPRPLTHDLMVDVLGSLGADLDKVVITDVSEGTFFAELHLKSRQGPLTVSARPSDAIAVAVRAGCGIYVDESVMDTAGRIAQFDDDDSDQPPGEVDELVDEFRDFIDSIKPEDFAP
jgi:bifunctional DNase/RNase